MTVFWIITATMIAVALALLAPTLLRRHATISDATERFNVEIARERLADLVREKETGGLSDEEFEQAKRDLELALAQDLEGTATAAPASRSGGRWAGGLCPHVELRDEKVVFFIGLLEQGTHVLS